VSPARRRCAVAHVPQDVAVRARRACRALSQPRSTQRYQRRPKADEAMLLKAIEALVCRHPSYGYRMIHAMLVAAAYQPAGRNQQQDQGYQTNGLRLPRRRILLPQDQSRLPR